jgi:hypothetical protein
MILVSYLDIILKPRAAGFTMFVCLEGFWGLYVRGVEFVMAVEGAFCEMTGLIASYSAVISNGRERGKVEGSKGGKIC